MRTEIELFNRKQCLLTNNLFGTSKINEITNLPIHEFKVLQDKNEYEKARLKMFFKVINTRCSNSICTKTNAY